MSKLLHITALVLAGSAYFQLALKHGGCYWTLLLYPGLESIVLMVDHLKKQPAKSPSNLDGEMVRESDLP